MAELNDVRVFGFIGPPDDTDTFASHYALYGRGGWRSVADHATRNAMTIDLPDRCEEGMVVTTLDDGGSWQLGAPTWTGTDADWTAITGAGHTHNILLGGGADIVVADDVTAWYIILPIAGRFDQFDIAAKVGPVGADAIFDLLLSTDHGSTWTSLWASTPSDRPKIVAGSNNGTGDVFETTTFPAGSWLRTDIKQVGSTTAGQGINIALTVIYTG